LGGKAGGGSLDSLNQGATPEENAKRSDSYASGLLLLRGGRQKEERTETEGTAYTTGRQKNRSKGEKKRKVEVRPGEVELANGRGEKNGCLIMVKSLTRGKDRPVRN